MWIKSHNRTALSLSALLMALADDKVMAAAAMAGESIIPVKG